VKVQSLCVQSAEEGQSRKRIEFPDSLVDVAVQRALQQPKWLLF